MDTAEHETALARRLTRREMLRGAGALGAGLGLSLSVCALTSVGTKIGTTTKIKAIMFPRIFFVNSFELIATSRSEEYHQSTWLMNPSQLFAATSVNHASASFES